MLHSLPKKIQANMAHCLRKIVPAYPKVPSLLLILAVVIGITGFTGALSYLYSKNSEEKESAQILQNLRDKADVLVWALEGSARTMMSSRRNDNPLFLSADLLQEIANQPGIVSLCLVDRQGEILVHSDPDNLQGHGVIGENKHLPETSILAGLDKKGSIGRFVLQDEKRSYEVIKKFTPNDGHHMNSHRRGMMRRWHMMQEMQETIDALGPFYMIVAFDAEPYDSSLLEVRQKNTFLSLVITGAVCSLVILFLVLYNFFRSRRLLNDARALASQIVTNLPIGLITTDKKGHITLFNSQSLHLLSLNAQSVPTSITQLPYLNWREIMQRLNTTTNHLFEEEIEIPLGETGSRAISLSAAKVHSSDGSESGYLCILRDLQTAKSLQKQIRLNERLSALGNMAAGVAHEIRNPLSTIKGYATYLSEKLKDDPKAYATGHFMIEEVERLNRVVTDLLYLAKPESLSLVSVNISEIAHKALQLASFDASSKNIHLNISEGEPPLTVKGDPDKLIQALLNILLNSVQAITHPDGNITLSVQRESSPLEMDEDNTATLLAPSDSSAKRHNSVVAHKEKTGEYARRDALNTADKYVLIRIRDNGAGMSEETLGNLFTPYFSTKASGSGLGMTITHQIIDLHNGSISVSSVLGEGTVFTIRLPLDTPLPTLSSDASPQGRENVV